MQHPDRTETINLLLEGMVVTGRSLQWVNDIEQSGVTPGFPGAAFTTELHELKQLANEAQAAYKYLVRGLGSIPIRLEFSSGEVTAAEIIELANFKNGQWHYKYKVGDSTADHSSTSENLIRAFRASMTPESEELKPQ